MTEEWRDVIGYEGLYQVSDMGRIKSLGFDKCHKGRILEPAISRDGYKRVSLCGKGRPKMALLHRLIGMAFVSGYRKDLFVNHKNEIKTDNRSENLEWCTKEYNNTYNGKAQRCCKRIVQMDADWNEIKEWSGAREAGKTLGIQYKNISSVCRGLRNFAGGFRWKFAKEIEKA